MKSTTAYIGIAGALGMAIGDLILLAQPVSGSSYDLSSFGAMAAVSNERALLGSTLGLVCAFFICFGFWYVMDLFQRIDDRAARWIFIALCSVEFFGGTFHAAYYFIANPQNLPTSVVSAFTRHLELISYLGVPGYIIGSILFFKYAINPCYPKWFRWTNPLVIHGILLIIFYFLPAPVGGYLKPTFINVGFVIFFIFCLRVGQAISTVQAPKKY